MYQDVRKAIQGSQLIFIAVNTPSRSGDCENSEAKGGFDLAAYESVARTIAGTFSLLHP